MAGAAWGAGGAGGEAWQSGHMTSRYRSVLAEPLRAPEMRGTTRHDEIRANASATPGTVPPETIGSYTQRSWKSGPTRGPGKRSKLGHGPRAGGGVSATGPGNHRHRGKNPGSSPAPTGGRSSKIR